MAKNSGILTTVADAFSEVAQTVNSPRPYVEIGRLVRVCRLLSPLLSSLGVFKFAEKEFSAKVYVSDHRNYRIIYRLNL